MKAYRIQQRSFSVITQTTINVLDDTKFQFIQTSKEDLHNVAFITSGDQANIIKSRRLTNSFHFLLPNKRLLVILKDVMGKPFEPSQELDIDDFYMSCFPKNHPERALELYHVLEFTGSAFKVVRVRFYDPLTKVYNPRVEYTTVPMLELFRNQEGISRGPETLLFTNFIQKEDFDHYMDFAIKTLKGDTNCLLNNEILYNSGAV